MIKKYIFIWLFGFVLSCSPDTSSIHVGTETEEYPAPTSSARPDNRCFLAIKNTSNNDLFSVKYYNSKGSIIDFGTVRRNSKTEYLEVDQGESSITTIRDTPDRNYIIRSKNIAHVFVPGIFVYDFLSHSVYTE